MADLYDSDGLEYFLEQCMGANELAWLQAKYQDDLLFRVRGNMASPGFIGRQSNGHANAFDYGWSVYDPAGNGVLTLKQTNDGTTTLDKAGQPWHNIRQPFRLLAFDRQGYHLRIPRLTDFDITVTVPNDGIWRTLVMRRVRTKQEFGTLTVVTASAAVVGVNTEFTRHIGASDPSNTTGRGDLLRIDAADTVNGNDGTIEIDLVNSDTSLTLVSAVPGTNEAGIPYQIAGQFLVGTPADPDIHNNTVVEFELIARQIQPAADDDLIVADIVRTGGVTSIVDRRHSNLFRPVSRDNSQFQGYKIMNQASMLTPGTTLTAGTARVYGIDTYITPLVGDLNRIAVSMGNEDEGLLIVAADALGNLDSAQLPLRELDRGATNLTFANFATGGFDPQLIEVPLGYGITHIVVYQTGQTLSIRTTGDNGTTWSGATVIWNPTLVDPLDAVGDPTIVLTRDHRIIVLGAYTDDSAARTTIRGIWSDNIGDAVLVWDTNANAGHTIVDDGVIDTITPDIAQDDEGNLFIAFSRVGAANSTINVVRGRDENDPRPGGPDAEVIGAGYVGLPVSAQLADIVTLEQRPTGPRIWCGPTGIVVFYTHTIIPIAGNTVQIIGAMSVGWFDSRPQHAAFTQLRVIDTGIVTPGGPLNAGIDIIQTPDGGVQLYYVHDDNVPQLQGVWHPTIPVRMDRPLGSYRKEPFS